MIPKIIHYCRFGGQVPKGLITQCISSFKKLESEQIIDTSDLMLKVFFPVAHFLTGYLINIRGINH